MMKLIFNELYIFDTGEKTARKIEFIDGVNVITSSQVDGTDRGKSVIMRSLYHSLGADAHFDNKWDTKSKIYILKFSIDEHCYYMYRSVDLFKLFNSNNQLLFTTNSRHEFSQLFKEYTGFAVQLPDRTKRQLEITPPAFNYLLNFLDQDHYEYTTFSSFKNLAQYTNYKENVLYYHLGAYDEKYFELIRQRDYQNNEHDTKIKRYQLLQEMQIDVEQKIEGSPFSTDMDILKSEISMYRDEYSTISNALRKSKENLLELRNSQFEAEQALDELNALYSKTEKDIKCLHERRCPECNSIISDTIFLQSKKYNLNEDIVLVKSQIQTLLLGLAKSIEEEECKYNDILSDLKSYEERMKINTAQISDILKHKGFCEIRNGIVSEKSEIEKSIQEIENKISEIKKDIKKYNDKKKRINKAYYSLLIDARTMFGLNEIEPDCFKSITNNFSASGSNKPIATIIWYLTLISLKKTFNPSAISFPIVFDSPNNVETDDTKRQSLMQYILNAASDNEQMILSSIGFDQNAFNVSVPINIITLNNDKYHLLDENSYSQYYNLLETLCDAK